MNRTDMKVKIEKEQKEVEVLIKKRAKLDMQIKGKTEKIFKMENQIKQNDFTELEESLGIKGLSIEELKVAIEQGDVSRVLAKLTSAK